MNCLFAMALMVLVFPYQVGMSQSPEGENQDLSDVSLAELLDLGISLASKTEEPVSEAPSIVAVITAQDIDNMGARNFEDILRTIPGFDVVLNPSASNLGVSVRGVLSTNATNNQVKFLINGHHVHSIVGGGPHHYLDYLPVHNIQKIEIIRGPGSALYGANAFSAVLNIITKGNNTVSEVSFSAGSYSTTHPSIFWSEDIQDWNIAISASYLDTEGYQGRIESDAATQIFGPAFSAAPGKTTESADNFTLQADVTHGNLKFTGLFNRLNKDYAIGIANALTDENRLDLDAGYTEASYSREFSSGKGDLVIRSYYDFFNFSPKFEIFGEETASLFNLLYSDTDPYPEGEGVLGQPGIDFYLFGSEITAKYKVHPSIQVLGGLLYDYSKIYNPTHVVNSNVSGAPLQIGDRIYRPFEYIGPLQDISNIPGGNWIDTGDRTNFASYAQARLDFRDLLQWTDSVESFALTLGLRHDDYSDIGSTTNPRVGLVFSPNSKVFFKGLYGEAFRAPTFDELYQINNPSFIGNPNLRPQKLNTKEIQVGTNYSENWFITLSFFDTRIDDIINLVPISSSEQTGNQFANSGEIHSKGFEFDAKFALTGYRYFYVNATFQEAENTTNAPISAVTSTGQVIDCHQPNFSVGNVPEIIFNGGLNWDFSGNFNWNINYNYTSSRERMGLLAFTPEEASVQRHEGSFTCVEELLTQVDQRPDTPSRFLLNTAIRWEILPGLQLRLSGFNLLDDDHLDPDSSGAIRDDIPRAGSTYQADIRYRF